MNQEKPEGGETGPGPIWALTFDRTLERETLRTACRRTSITVGVMFFLLLLVFGLRLLSPVLGPELHQAFSRLFWPSTALLSAYLVYETLVRFWQGRLLRQGRAMPARFPYWHVLVEITLPTLALVIAAGNLGPVPALCSSVPFLYFLVVLLTTLNLNPRLCLYAGGWAGAQLVVVSFLFERWPSPLTRELAALSPFLVAPHQYVVKGLLLVASGCLAGFAANRIRHQVEVALRTVEERDKAVSIFGQHVSPQVAEMLLRQPIAEVGEERNVCIMFLDIRDFSRLAGACSPAKVMEYLNTLFGFMIPVVNQHKGIINKFLGDGFMAVFGAPVDDRERCRHALDAAFEILLQVDQLNRTGKIPATRLGIGLHMGQAVTGSVGTSDRKEYTIIGDVVNLAARIEQATKQFGAPLLVSESVWNTVAGLAGYPSKDLGPVELKGQAKPVRLFRIDPPG